MRTNKKRERREIVLYLSLKSLKEISQKRREESLTEELSTKAISSRSASRRASPSIPIIKPKQFDNSNFAGRVSRNERSLQRFSRQSPLKVLSIQRSPLSDELSQVWILQGKATFFNRLRSLKTSDPHLKEFIETKLTKE